MEKKAIQIRNYVTIIFLMLTLQGCVKSLNSKKENTEIYIIGTVHFENEYQNADTIYEILLDLKPDLILAELDSSFFTKEFKLDTANFSDLLNTCENAAIYRYSNLNKVDIRPFDIAGRNQYYREIDFFRNQKQMYNDIGKIESTLDSTKLEDIFLMNLALMSTNNNSYNSMSDLNSKSNLKLTKLRQRFFHDKTISILRDEEIESKWIWFAREQKRFWNERNLVMGQNILQFINIYRGKRIVVLVGHMHKYALYDYLTNKEEENEFKMKKYYK